MAAYELDPATAVNYQLLVDSGDRTWADVAAMADRQQSPDLAAYAREKAGDSKPSAPKPASEPAAQRSTPPPQEGGR